MEKTNQGDSNDSQGGRVVMAHPGCPGKTVIVASKITGTW